MCHERLKEFLLVIFVAMDYFTDESLSREERSGLVELPIRIQTIRAGIVFMWSRIHRETTSAAPWGSNGADCLTARITYKPLDWLGCMLMIDLASVWKCQPGKAFKRLSDRRRDRHASTYTKRSRAARGWPSRHHSSYRHPTKYWIPSGGSENRLFSVQ